MNLPNALTILRIFFVPLLVAALVQETGWFQVGGVRVTNDWLSLGIFLVAAFTDLLDGYLARRWKQVFEFKDTEPAVTVVHAQQGDPGQTQIRIDASGQRVRLDAVVLDRGQIPGDD